MMAREVYLDNSSTTPMHPEVLKEMQTLLERKYGNPSSLHRLGNDAERTLSSSRQLLAEQLGVKSGEIYFTSGGTESNNMALAGIARRNYRRGKHLLTSKIEHPSVLEPLKKLEVEGFQVTYLEPDRNGLLDPFQLAETVTPKTILVSVMHVNNEIGTIQPIAEIAAAIKRKNPQTIVHVDAVQSFTRLPLSPREQGIDVLSISAHKFHGPKGTGALYIRGGILVEPLLAGGEQEKGLRAGTENTPGIAAMALAARLNSENRKEKTAQSKIFKEKMLSSIETAHPWAQINGPRKAEGVPNILNISFPGLKGEIILHALEEHNIFVSTGSACHSRKNKPSHVLEAIGAEKAALDGAIRISFSSMNTPEEIEYAAFKIPQVISELKAFMS